MKTWALLCLLTLSPQQQITKPTDTVALVFGPEPRQILIIKKEAAERKYEQLKKELAVNPEPKEEDLKIFAALVLALGTQRQDAVECHNGVRENWVGEQFICGN